MPHDPARLSVFLAREAPALHLEVGDWDPKLGRAARTYWIEADGDLLPPEQASWADWDPMRGNRLLSVRRGRLFAQNPPGAAARLLFDPAPCRPDPQPAPAEAARWP